MKNKRYWRTLFDNAKGPVNYRMLKQYCAIRMGILKPGSQANPHPMRQGTRYRGTIGVEQ